MPGEAVGTGYFNTGNPSTSRIKRLEIEVDQSGPGGVRYGGSPYVTVDSMVVRGGYSRDTPGHVLLQEYGEVVDLTTELSSTLVPGSILVKVEGDGTVRRYVDRGRTEGQSALFANVAGDPVLVTLSGYARGGRLLDLHSDATVLFAGVTHDQPGAAPIYLGGASLDLSGVLMVVGDELAATVERGGGEALRINGAMLRQRLTDLSPADGDQVFNTAEAASTGVGPVVYSASAVKWKHLYSGLTT